MNTGHKTTMQPTSLDGREDLFLYNFDQIFFSDCLGAWSKSEKIAEFTIAARASKLLLQVQDLDHGVPTVGSTSQPGHGPTRCLDIVHLTRQRVSLTQKSPGHYSFYSNPPSNFTQWRSSSTSIARDR